MSKVLAVNIGNTNIRFSNGLVLSNQVNLNNVASNDLGDGSMYNKTAIISSVVPSLTNKVKELLIKHQFTRFMFLDKTDRQIVDASDYAQSLGDDRFAVCYGAAIKSLEFSSGLKKPFVVCDLGTTTTFNIVDTNHKLIGGSIMLGIQSQLDAFSQKTALLPNIKLLEYDQNTINNIDILGATTEDNLLIGTVVTTADSINSMVQRINDRLGQKTDVFITGGNAIFIRKYIKFDHFFCPHLVLDGLLSYASRFMDDI